MNSVIKLFIAMNVSCILIIMALFKMFENVPQVWYLLYLVMILCLFDFSFALGFDYFHSGEGNLTSGGGEKP